METLGIISIVLATIGVILLVNKLKSFIELLYHIPILFGYFIVVLGFVIWYWELSPLRVNEVRLDYIKPRYLLTAYVSSLIYFFGAFLVFKMSPYKTFEFRNSSSTTIVFYVLLALISSYLVNGTNLAIFGGYGLEGFKTNRWGGWPLIFMYSTARLITIQGREKLRFRVLFFLLIYWFLAGNRSEILLLALLLIKFRSLKIEKFRVFHFIFPAFLIALSFDLLGRIRSSGLSLDSVKFILTNSSILADGALSISTVGSSYYTLIASIGLADKYGFLYGKSYLGYLVNSVPSFVPVPWSRIEDIAWYTQEAGTIGGSLFFAESYLNFGLAGVLMFSFGFHLIWVSVWKDRRIMSLSIVFRILLLIYFQRYFLYGFVYFWKSIILFFILFLIKPMFKR